MKRAASTIAAFILAPSIPAIIALIPFAFQRGTWAEAWHAIAIAYSLFAIAEIALGIPVFFLGKWLEAINWKSCMIAGFVAGSIMGLYISGGLLYLMSVNLIIIGLFGLPGALSGLLFWVIWRAGHV